MTEPDDDDLDLLAAQYALGVLDLAERREEEARRRGEPALDAAVVRWEARLAPHVEAFPPVAPPDSLWPRIENALPRPAAVADLVELLRQRARRWKYAALSCSATPIRRPSWSRSIYPAAN